MTKDELSLRITAKLPALERVEPGVRDYLTMRLSHKDELLETARVLRDELGFDYLEMVTAVDWLGAVKPEGFIRNPNPIVFLPEGATPQSIPEATAGFPYRPMLEMVWLFGNLEQRIRLFLRLEIPRENAEVPSLAGLFQGADWQERETFDLMGIRFQDHPNLKKILSPDFIAGHPLRKDYVHVKDRYDE